MLKHLRTQHRNKTIYLESLNLYRRRRHSPRYSQPSSITSTIAGSHFGGFHVGILRAVPMFASSYSVEAGTAAAHFMIKCDGVSSRCVVFVSLCALTMIESRIVSYDVREKSSSVWVLCNCLWRNRANAAGGHCRCQWKWVLIGRGIEQHFSHIHP